MCIYADGHASIKPNATTIHYTSNIVSEAQARHERCYTRTKQSSILHFHFTKCAPSLLS